MRTPLGWACQSLAVHRMSAVPVVYPAVCPGGRWLTLAWIASCPTTTLMRVLPLSDPLDGQDRPGHDGCVGAGGGVLRPGERNGAGGAGGAEGRLDEQRQVVAGAVGAGVERGAEGDGEGGEGQAGDRQAVGEDEPGGGPGDVDLELGVGGAVGPAFVLDDGGEVVGGVRGDLELEIGVVGGDDVGVPAGVGWFDGGDGDEPVVDVGG